MVDFYCPEVKLVIEVDGDTHCSEGGKTYDEERTRILGSYGLSVIRFSNVDVLDNFGRVCREVESAGRKPPNLLYAKGEYYCAPSAIVWGFQS